MSERIGLTVSLAGRADLEMDVEAPLETTPVRLLQVLQAQARWPAGQYAVETTLTGARLNLGQTLEAAGVHQGEKLIFVPPQTAAVQPPAREPGWPLVAPRPSTAAPLPAPAYTAAAYKPSLVVRSPRRGLDWSDPNVKRLGVASAVVIVIYVVLLVVWLTRPPKKANEPLAGWGARPAVEWVMHSTEVF